VTSNVQGIDLQYFILLSEPAVLLAVTSLEITARSITSPKLTKKNVEQIY
jgi:hypothetical protein